MYLVSLRIHSSKMFDGTHPVLQKIEGFICDEKTMEAIRTSFYAGIKNKGLDWFQAEKL